jgi:hypothetical protein
LQLLLIIDYIFDWARDIYKASIVSQLIILANPTKDMGRDPDDDFTIAETDSDVFSLARPEQKKAIEAWGVGFEEPSEAAPEEELSLMKWATHDSPLGVFRPAYISSRPYSAVSASRKRMSRCYSQACRKSILLRSLL